MRKTVKKKVVERKRQGKPLRPEELFEKNQRLAYNIANQMWDGNSHKFKQLAMDLKDVWQEAIIALNKSTLSYDASRGKFGSYAGEVINNHLIQITRKMDAKKRQAKIVSLETGEEGNRLSLADTLKDERKPLGQTIRLRKQMAEIVQGLPGILEKHKQIFIARFGLIDGRPKTVEAVSKQFNCSYNTIRYASNKILHELRKEPKVQWFKEQL